MDAPIWDVTVFTKNRERLLAGDVAAKFLARVLNQPVVKTLLSDEHFSVDGTLIEAWASIKELHTAGQRRARRWRSGPRMAHPRVAMPSWRLSRRETQQRLTHASTTDPRCPAVSKGAQGKKSPAVPHGPFADGKPARPDRRCHADPRPPAPPSNPKTAITMLGQPRPGRHRITLGADKAYDVADFVDRLRAIQGDPACGAKPHQPPLGDRPAHHPTPRLRRRPAITGESASRRRSAGSKPAADCAKRGTAATPCRLDLHPDRRRLQPDPVAQAAGGSHEAYPRCRGQGLGSDKVAANAINRTPPKPSPSSKSSRESPINSLISTPC